MNKKLIATLIVVIVVAAVAGIVAQQYIAPGPPVELRVFAAASLVNVVNASQPTFEKANNAKLLVNLASSSTLYAQIVAGTPADVFMSADSSYLAKLNNTGLLYNGKYWNFTTNILVVILPANNPQHITTLSDLTKPGVRIAVAAWSVPVGGYTNTSLTTITKTWGNNASSLYKGSQYQNYRLNVVKNIITYETNDEQVVEKVRLGVVDAGFAYMTDALFYSNSSQLKFVAIPSDVNIKAQYGIGVVKNSTQTVMAMKYVNFWIGSDGQNLLTKYGFGNTLPMAISTELLQFQSIGTMTVTEIPKSTEAQ